MAKYKRTVLGSVLKSQDPEKANYIKISDKLEGGVITLSAGQYINVESKSFQLKSLEKAAADGKISGEALEGARERIRKIPDFVLGDLILISNN